MLRKIWNYKIVKFTIRYLLPLIIMAFIVANIDFTSMKNVLSRVKTPYLFFGFLGTLLQFASYAYRWDLILKFTDIQYSFGKAFRVYLANFFIGTFVPGTFGGFLKVLHLKRDGWSVDKGIVSVVFEKVYEIFFTTFFALVMMLLVPSLYRLPVNIFYSIGLLVTVAAVLYIARKPIIDFIKNFVSQRVENAGVRFQTASLIEGMRNVLALRNTSILILVSFMVRLGEVITFYFIARSLGSHLNFIQALFFSAIVAIITSLPVSFSGIGSRDLTLIMLFATIGESKEIALGTSVLILISIILMRLIGMAFWLHDPISKGKIADEAGI